MSTVLLLSPVCAAVLSTLAALESPYFAAVDSVLEGTQAPRSAIKANVDKVVSKVFFIILLLPCCQQFGYAIHHLSNS